MISYVVHVPLRRTGSVLMICLLNLVTLGGVLWKGVFILTGWEGIGQGKGMFQ